MSKFLFNNNILPNIDVLKQLCPPPPPPPFPSLLQPQFWCEHFPAYNDSQHRCNNKHGSSISSSLDIAWDKLLSSSCKMKRRITASLRLVLPSYLPPHYLCSVFRHFGTIIKIGSVQ